MYKKRDIVLLYNKMPLMRHLPFPIRIARTVVLQVREIKVSGNSLKKGHLISGSTIPGQPANRILRVIETTSVKQGRGNAYVQVKMADYKTNQTLAHKFRAAEDVEVT